MFLRGRYRNGFEVLMNDLRCPFALLGAQLCSGDARHGSQLVIAEIFGMINDEKPMKMLVYAV